jgi:hypothetical protein
VLRALAQLQQSSASHLAWALLLPLAQMLASAPPLQLVQLQVLRQVLRRAALV